MKIKRRTYIARLKSVYGINTDPHRATRVLSGVFITKDRGSSVIDERGQYYAYQYLQDDSYFELYLDDRWVDVKKEAPLANNIMSRHYREDNALRFEPR